MAMVWGLNTDRTDLQIARLQEEWSQLQHTLVQSQSRHGNRYDAI